MNQQIFFFFYNLAHHSAFFDKLVVFTAVDLPYIVILAAGIYLLFYYKIFPSQNPIKELISKWKEFFWVFFAVAAATIVDLVLKALVHAPRPFLILPQVQNLFLETGFAFPSGHATFFSALAVTIFLRNKKAGYVFMVCALLIGLARITAGVHFPIDILGGFILGSAIAYFLKYV